MNRAPLNHSRRMSQYAALSSLVKLKPELQQWSISYDLPSEKTQHLADPNEVLLLSLHDQRAGQHWALSAQLQTHRVTLVLQNPKTNHRQELSVELTWTRVIDITLLQRAVEYLLYDATGVAAEAVEQSYDYAA